MTLLLLNAINAALELWREKLEGDRIPLPLAPEFWHVGQTYELIREAVMSLDRIPGEAAAIPACEKLLKAVDARICHIRMHAFTEWTPRVIPERTSLLAIINNLVEGADAEGDLYDGPDIVPLKWQLDDDELDVHMIAIAANVTPWYDDDLFGGMDVGDDWYMDDDMLGRHLRQKDATKEEHLRTLKKRGKDKDQGKNKEKKGKDGNNQGDKNQNEKKQDGKGKKGKGNDDGNDKGNGNDGNNLDDSTTGNDDDGDAKNEVPQLQMFSGQKLEIAEGSGWKLVNVPVGFCDGSAQSRCNRRSDNRCLLANHNHYRGSVVGGPLTKWLTMRVPGVKHGIVLARLEFAHSPQAEELPADFVFDYAVNGVVRSIPKSELPTFRKQIVSGLGVFPLVNDRDAVVDGERLGVDYEIAIRIRSAADPKCVVRLSHIYFA